MEIAAHIIHRVIIEIMYTIILGTNSNCDIDIHTGENRQALHENTLRGMV
jgi:hypothetical protein